MSNTITSQKLGQLRQDESIPEWWTSEAVAIPLFDGKNLTVTFMDLHQDQDPIFIKEADEALNNFFRLDSHSRDALSHLVYKNCMDFLDDIGYNEADAALWQIKNQNEIWKHVYPDEIFVLRRLRRDKDIYIKITCECDWEQEHGLQLVFRQGKKLTRISDQDGHITEADAYDKPDEEDELLSSF